MIKKYSLKKIHLLITIIFSLGFTGCIPALIGTGVVAGYSLSNDSAVGTVRISYRKLWDIALSQVEYMRGEKVDADESKGTIKADINGYEVVIRIDTLTNNDQRLRVKARKFMLPKPEFAQNIFVKIIRGLKI